MCADIDECKEKTRCQCPDCQCTNTWGGYDCQCSNDLLYIREHDVCISKPLFLESIHEELGKGFVVQNTVSNVPYNLQYFFLNLSFNFTTMELALSRVVQ